MSADPLLDRLHGVRRIGEGRWRAKCPACGSNKPALAITETADETVLLHCFREGCAVADIVGAVGLELDTLFPPRVEGVHASKPVKRRRFSAAQVLPAVSLELIEVLVIVGAILRRGRVSPTEYDRLKLAVSRVSMAEGACRD